MSSRSIRICIIGAGRAGMIHGLNFARGGVELARVTAVVDPDDILRQSAAKILGLDFSSQTFADYRSAFTYGAFDGVVIATPTVYHREIAVAAAGAGKHVLCEKPMALSADDCDAMMDACSAAQVNLQIGFMRRFDAGFRDAYARLLEGEIGELVHVRSLTHGPSIPQPWMYDLARSNGPLAEVNSHDIDTAHWFSGDTVSSVYAMAGNYRSPDARATYPDFYDQIHLSLKFRGGAQGSISGAQGTRYAYDARAEIIGTEGIILVGGLQSHRVTSINCRNEMRASAVKSWRDLFSNAYLEEDRAFVRSILDQSPSPVPGYFGKEAVKVVVAGNLSAKQGAVVPLEEES